MEWTTTCPAMHVRALRAASPELGGSPAAVADALHLLALWTQLVGLSIIAGLFANVFASNDAPRRSASPGYGTNQPNAHSSSDKWSPGGRHMGGAHESTCSETCAHAVLRATGPWPWSAVVFCVANSALLCVTGFLIHSLFELPQQMSFGKALSECGLYLPFLCSVAGVLLLTSAGLIAFGMRVRARIALHKWGPNHRARIDRVVKRLTVTLVACAACYALRVAALFSLFSENVRDNRVFSPIVWECLSYWVPTVVPSAVLLVMMRGPGKSRPGRNQEDGVTAAQSASVGHSAHYVHTASAANNVVAGQGVAVLAGVGSGAQTTLESPLMDSAQGVAMGSSPSAGGHGSELSDVSSGDDFA